MFLLCVQETWYWPGEVGADAVVMSGVRCSGTEMSLSHCLHHGAHLNCPKGGGRHAAGVSCSESKVTETILRVQTGFHSLSSSSSSLSLRPQRLQTWCSTLRWWSRPPTWRTGPCSCCSAPTRRTAWPPPPARRPPPPTAACCASPRRSTTTASPTSGPKRTGTPGSGTTVTGRMTAMMSGSYYHSIKSCNTLCTHLRREVNKMWLPR